MNIKIINPYTMAKLERLAKKQGISVKEYLERLLKTLASSPKFS